MAYGSAKGRIFRGDIYAAEDTNQDTYIDWGNDFISFGVGGVKVLNVSASDTLVQVLGNVSASLNITASGHVSASTFYGDGQHLKNITTSPAGASKQIQYNEGGVFYADSSLQWDATPKIFEVSGTISASQVVEGLSFSSSILPGFQTKHGFFGTNLVSPGSDDLTLRVGPDSSNTAGSVAFASAGVEKLRIQLNNLAAGGDSNDVLIASQLGNIVLKNGPPGTGQTTISGSLSASLNITASAFYGDGANLTNLPGGTPGGSTIELQYNNGGVFDGAPDLKYVSAGQRRFVVGDSGFITTMTGALHVTGAGGLGFGTLFSVGNSVAGSGSIFTVTGSGRVGVGTTTPQTTLHVSGSGSTGGAVFRVDSNMASEAILFVTGSGRVGIGTTSPARTLEIVDPTSAAFQLTALNARGAGQDNSYSFISDGYGFSIFDTTTGGTPGYRFLIADGGGATTRGYVAIGDGAGMGGSNYPTAQLHVSSSDGGPTFRVDGELANPALFVTGSGRVGIGTATPGTTLDILGTTLADQLRLGHGGTHYYKMGRATDGFFHIQGTQQDYTGYIFKDAAGNGGGSLVTIGNSLALNVHYTGSGNPIYLDDDKGGGEVVYFGTSSASGLQPGALYYLNTDGGWASASAEATGDDPVNGGGQDQLLALSLGHDPQADGMLLRGYFHADSYYQKDFAIGKPVYVSTSSAHYKGYLPTASSNFARVIGYGTSRPNVIYFNPDSTYEVI